MQQLHIDTVALLILKQLAQHVLTTNLNRTKLYPGPLADRQSIELAIKLANHSLTTNQEH